MLAALVILLLLGGALDFFLTRNRETLHIPDDTKVAREILIQRFSSPQYFQLGTNTEEMPHPYLASSAVAAQLDRVTQLRKLSPPQVEKLNKIITKLTEPAPSRLAGDDRVNVLRLNLALDEMK